MKVGWIFYIGMWNWNLKAKLSTQKRADKNQPLFIFARCFVYKNKATTFKINQVCIKQDKRIAAIKVDSGFSTKLT